MARGVKGQELGQGQKQRRGQKTEGYQTTSERMRGRESRRECVKEGKREREKEGNQEIKKGGKGERPKDKPENAEGGGGENERDTHTRMETVRDHQSAKREQRKERERETRR